jgi:hypothetical protein
MWRKAAIESSVAMQIAHQPLSIDFSTVSVFKQMEQT